MELPVSDQVELVDELWKRILQSDESEAAIPVEHQEKIKSRIESLDSGEATAISGSELRAAIAAKIDQR